MSTYGSVQKGSLYSESFRLFLTKDGQVVSPFHDIPLRPDESNPAVVNMVVEVCRFTNAKMEITKELKLNPIKQDVKKGKMRFIANVFPNKGYPWNYGAFPQTWEDPNVVDSNTGYNGDSDPLDVCEIGDIIPEAGSVIQVKVLGVLAMIDEGETDWKVIAINTADPKAAEMNDIQDVEKVKPGLLARTVEWFKYYKVSDGKPVNNFAFNGEFKDQKFALEVVSHTNESWNQLIGKNCKCGDIRLENTTLDSSSDKVSAEDATNIVNESAEASAPSVLPDTINNFFYVPAGL